MAEHHSAAVARRGLGPLPMCVRGAAAFASMILAMVVTGAAAEPETRAPVKIVLVGDSLTAQQTGWGGAFCDLHVAESVACVPLGRGGRSTRTYRREGTWALVLDELRVPGYAERWVLIEMGHNDKSSVPEVGTDSATFEANLEVFVAEVRAIGAVPVLVTPTASRRFVEGKLVDSLEPWARSVRAVADRLGSAAIDLNRLSAQHYASIGALRALDYEIKTPTEAERHAAESGTTLPARVRAGSPADKAMLPDDPNRANMADHLHLNRRGAEMLSAMVARELRQVAPTLRARVLP